MPLWYCSGARCKACASAASHASAIEKKYGVTEAEYQRLYKLQGGRCAICGNRPRSKRLALDHDHVTGKPRGLLCSGKDRSGCNVALGIFHDSLEIVQRAAAYLEAPPAAGEVYVGGLRKVWTPRGQVDDGDDVVPF